MVMPSCRQHRQIVADILDDYLDRKFAKANMQPIASNNDPIGHVEHVKDDLVRGGQTASFVLVAEETEKSRDTDLEMEFIAPLVPAPESGPDDPNLRNKLITTL